MTARRGLAFIVGAVLALGGTLEAMQGSATAMIVLFAGLILLALAFDRG